MKQLFIYFIHPLSIFNFHFCTFIVLSAQFISSSSDVAALKSANTALQPQLTGIKTILPFVNYFLIVTMKLHPFTSRQNFLVHRLILRAKKLNLLKGKDGDSSLSGTTKCLWSHERSNRV